MKTRGYAMATLSLKNIVLAAPMNFGKDNNYRAKMHEEPFHENPRFFNYNMFRMSQYVSPDLALIDGFVGMEKDGPPIWCPDRSESRCRKHRFYDC